MGRLVLRLLDETELYFLLGDRSYTQLISAIQVFFNGLPFKGAGIFELNYLNVSSAPPTANNYKTFELLSSPPAIDMVEFGNQTVVTDYHGKNNPFSHQATTIDWKGNINDTDGLNSSYPHTNEKILVTGAHEDILRMKTNQIIRLLEHVIQSKILKISLLYYFNTSLTPFIVSCESVVIESKGFLSASSSPSARAINPAMTLHGGSSVAEEGSSSPLKDEEIEKLKQSELEERNAMLSKFQMEPSSRGMRIQYNRMESDIEVIGVPSSQKSHTASSSPPKPLQRSASDIYGNDDRIKREISREVRKNSQPTLPPPPQPFLATSDEVIDEDVDNFYRERIPNRTELKSKFGGKRMTMLGNFISLGPSKLSTKDQPLSSMNATSPSNNNTLTSTILSQYKIGIGTERYPKDSIKSKHYAQPTDSCTYRIKAYSDRIKGSASPPAPSRHTTSKKSLTS
jgi:hypothetical protein